MGKEKHGGYKRVNGRPRNEAVHLTDAELREMEEGPRAVRHTDGMTGYERRAALLKSRGVDIKRGDSVK